MNSVADNMYNNIHWFPLEKFNRTVVDKGDYFLLGNTHGNQSPVGGIDGNSKKLRACRSSSGLFGIF